MKLLCSLVALLCLMPSWAMAAGARLPPSTVNSPVVINSIPTTLGAAVGRLQAKDVTQRAPLATDDWSAGYYAAGSVSDVGMTALGSGYTTATATFSASGNTCLVVGTLQPVVYNGQVIALRQKTPSTGCSVGNVPPTIVIAGDGTGAAASAKIAPVGAGWIDQNGAIYRVLRDTPGAAMWQRQILPANARAADVVSGAAFACGEDLLRSGYTGAAYSAARVDGTTAKDIGFVGGSLDYGALDAYAAGKATGVATCYDQVGANNAVGQSGVGTLIAMTAKAVGTGYASAPTVAFSGSCTTLPTATAAVSGGGVTGYTITEAGAGCTTVPTATLSGGGGSGATFALQVGSQPQLPPIPVVGNGRGMVFNSAVEVNGAGGNYRTANPAVTKFRQGLTIPSGLALNTQAQTVIVLAAMGQSQRDVPLVELSGRTFVSLMQKRSLGGLAVWTGTSPQSISAQFNFSPYTSPVTARAVGSISGSSGAYILAGEGQQGLYRGVFAASALTGGQIGCGTVPADTSYDPNCGNVAIRDVLIFSRALSPTEYWDVVMTLYRQAGIYPQVRRSDIADGDSITEGAFGSFLQSWPRLMSSRLIAPVNVYNVAVSGQTSTQNVAAIPSWINLCAKPGATFYHNAVGTNDIPAGGTSATIQRNIQTLQQYTMAAGCAPSFQQTILPRSSFVANPSYEAVRTAVNAWIRSNAATLGYTVVDAANDPTMGTTAALSNVQYYQDGTHPGYVFNGSGEGQGGLPFLALLHAAPVNAYLLNH